MSSWITGNRFLAMSEQKKNAVLVNAFFEGRGWTRNSIAAMLGNMQSESSINPGIWESLKPYKGGYGLVQWTPYTKYSNWAGDGWQDNGDKECAMIIHELEEGGQWIETKKYPMSFREFTQSDGDIKMLADVWLRNYERPANLNQPQRGTQAVTWYNYLYGDMPPKPPDVDPTPDPEPKPPEGGWSKIPLWLYMKWGNGL